MPKLFSYIRWSSDRQSQGTTESRQLKAARSYAAEHKLEMVEIIEPGVSAFRGKNRDGKLKDFIDAVKNGAISSDSWLFCENLDRLSRDQVDGAVLLFLELIGLGLTIVTGMDRKVYNKESLRQNPTDLMISILMFIRGNEESETKSKRTTGNVIALVERHKQGLPVNIKSVGRHPFWIDDTGSQYEPVKKHPEYWGIAREAIDLFLKGHGVYTVKRILDEKYPKGLKGKEWDYQVLKKMRDNRALIGERNVKVEGVEYKLENYYPWLCKDEAEFLTLAERKSQNKFTAKKGKVEEIKLLSGLNVLRCNTCKGTMHSFMNHGSARYICTNGVHLQKNCSGWSISAKLVEHCTIIALLIGYIDKNRVAGINTVSIDEDISKKERMLSDLLSRIQKLVKVIEMVDDVPEIAIELNNLNTQRKELVLDISKLKERLNSLKGKGAFELDVNEFIILVQYAVLTNLEDQDRHQIRKNISSIIECVYVEKVDGCITIKIKYHNKDEILCFGGFNRKPFWKFSVEFDEKNSVNVDDNENTISDSVMSKALGYLEEIENRYKKLFDIATEMLKVVSYPDINGAWFWPNTEKFDRVNVSFNGTTHSVALNGRVSKAVSEAMSSTGLTRAQFIERYRV